MARKILVVDDDPNAQRLVSYALQAKGYAVIVASNGAEALAHLAGERPDLVILDVMMPDMSGLDVCQRIRGNRGTAHLPILMLSARVLVADRVSGLKSGADDYLSKPADTDELVARVEALLSRSSHVPARAGQVLAFLGAKGGVGTTTVATNVAAEIAARGRSVYLVELRQGAGTAATLLKLQPAHDLAALLERAPADISLRTILSRCVARHASGLRLLAAPQSGGAGCEMSVELVEALTVQLLQDADWVIFDLAPSWTAANRAVVRQAHFTAVVCEPDALSLACARSTRLTLQQWDVMDDLVGLVLVNRGSNSRPRPNAAALPAGLAGTIPPAPDVSMAAAREGVPLVTLKPEHPISVALKGLAERLTQDQVQLLEP